MCGPSLWCLLCAVLALLSYSFNLCVTPIDASMRILVPRHPDCACAHAGYACPKIGAALIRPPAPAPAVVYLTRVCINYQYRPLCQDLQSVRSRVYIRSNVTRNPKAFARANCRANDCQAEYAYRGTSSHFNRVETFRLALVLQRAPGACVGRVTRRHPKHRRCQCCMCCVARGQPSAQALAESRVDGCEACTSKRTARLVDVPLLCWFLTSEH